MLMFLVNGTFASLSALEIVKDGQPRAQIIVAEERPRMVSLAALELQHYIERISGAQLPIATRHNSSAYPVAIYVGGSPATKALGVNADGLKYGAYRIVSGSNWLALVGSDFDYAPPEPWARGRNDSERAREDWDKLTGDKTDTAWGFPFHAYYKKEWSNREPVELIDRYGEANQQWWPDSDYSSGFWSDDEGGTLNAVYGWLKTLGTRWYMPGEIGEVIPTMASIPLQSFDLTVKPDFALRSWFWYNYGVFPLQDVLWARQIGLNGGSEILGGGQYGFAHGLVRVHGREEMQQAHPEYYALRGGVRDTEHRGHGTACFSSPGLERETINFARFMFDHYDWPKFSLWPGDGYRHCMCDECKDKSSSEAVWEFVDRVSRELYKSHPDKLVLCGAYTPYREPPESIKQFSPNVVVNMANRGRPTFTVENLWQHYLETVEAWTSRLAPGRLIRGDNNRYHMGETVSFPVIQATANARDLKMLKGISIGEISEQSQRRGILNPGANHLGLYVQASYLWDADQDLQSLLDEYFELFYGPAARQMQDAFAFAEDAYTRSVANAAGRDARSPDNVPISDRIDLIDRLQTAQRVAGNTIYGQRIQLLLNELPSPEELQRMNAKLLGTARLRDKTPIAVAQTDSSKAPQTYALRRIEKGGPAEIETRFTVEWKNNALVFTIDCDEPDMDNILVSPQVWDGDSVALLLESPSNSYYQIEINPDGVIFDSNRGNTVGTRWQSQATVETSRAATSWQVRITVPVVSPDEGDADPNHNVAGSPPSADNPWFFNVGRVRIRPGESGPRSHAGKTAWTFSPTGGSYHTPEKFARLITAD